MSSKLDLLAQKEEELRKINEALDLQRDEMFAKPSQPPTTMIDTSGGAAASRLLSGAADDEDDEDDDFR